MTDEQDTALSVVRIEHLQSLTYQGEKKPIEAVEVSVRLLYDALATGWLRKTFTGRGRGTDFLVFMAIALHARPLKGADLKLLIQLGVATPEDEGRLYARVTDIGLAAELGFDARQTIAASTRRLAESGLIDILPLPEDFRDSGGQFAGSKAYLISGDVNVLRKEVGPSLETSVSTELTRSPTVLTKPTRSSPPEPSTVLTELTRLPPPEPSTVLTELTRLPLPEPSTALTELTRSSTVLVKPVRVKLTQIGGGGGGGGGEDDSLLSLQRAFPQFAWDAPEQAAIEGLLRDGYSGPHITAVITDTLVDRPPDADPIRRLTFFEPIIRAEAPHADGDRARTTEPSRAYGDERDEVSHTDEHSSDDLTEGLSWEGDRLPGTDRKAPHTDGVDLVAIAQLYERAGLIFDQRIQAAFELLARHFSAPERDVTEWLTSAVEEAIIQGADHIPAYVRRVLSRWRDEAQGIHPAQSRPREGDLIPASGEALAGDSSPPESEPEEELLVGDRPASVLWKEILGRLQSQMTKATFATWLSPSRLTGCQDSTLLVTVPNCYVQEWLEHRLHGVIQRALNDFLGDGWQVRFVSADEEQEGKKV